MMTAKSMLSKRPVLTFTTVLFFLLTLLHFRYLLTNKQTREFILKYVSVVLVVFIELIL